MNFHWSFFARPAEPLPHVVVRHVIATRAESREAKALQDKMRLRLEAETARLTPEEWDAAIARGASVTLPVSELGRGRA